MPCSSILPAAAFVVTLALALTAAGQQPVAPAGASEGTDEPHPLRAHHLLTVADDFIVNVYHNGRQVPDDRRRLLEERFGATVEQVDLEVRKGDWIVFHVVNNRLRWGGARYFAVAGCFDRDEFGFVSETGTGAWSACDSPRDADRFIARRDHLRHQAALPIDNPWSDGTPLMKQHAGSAWDGQPLWGTSRSTWLKVVIE